MNKTPGHIGGVQFERFDWTARVTYRFADADMHTLGDMPCLVICVAEKGVYHLFVLYDIC